MTTGLLALVVGVVVAVVVAARVLELYGGMRLRRLTIADLFACSPRRLYLYSILAMRARLRGTRRPPRRQVRPAARPDISATSPIRSRGSVELDRAETRTGAALHAFVHWMLSRPLRAVQAVVHARLALATLAFAFIPTDTYRRVRIERMWHSTQLHVDGVIDGDLPLSRGTRRQFVDYFDTDGDSPLSRGIRRRFFDYFDTLVSAFGEPEVMDRRAILEVVSWLYVVRGCREMLGFDPIEPMREMWNLYSPDALRTLDGRPVTDAETLGRAHSCFVMSYRLVGRILGLSPERARLGAELGTPTQAAADTMRDLLADAQAGRLSVPIEELQRRGITVEDVFANSSSWETLARVDGLAEWCIEWARTQRVLLEETVLPTLRKEFFPYIRPRWRRSRLLVQMKHRIDFLRRYERQWRKRAGAATA